MLQYNHQVHDGIDWSVCEDFVVLPVLPIPLLAALDHAQVLTIVVVLSSPSPTSMGYHRP
jgi:hypothetical protein